MDNLLDENLDMVKSYTKELLVNQIGLEFTGTGKSSIVKLDIDLKLFSIQNLNQLLNIADSIVLLSPDKKLGPMMVFEIMKMIQKIRPDICFVTEEHTHHTGGYGSHHVNHYSDIDKITFDNVSGKLFNHAGYGSGTDFCECYFAISNHQHDKNLFSSNSPHIDFRIDIQRKPFNDSFKQKYITHFTENDFNCNRLKKVLMNIQKQILIMSSELIKSEVMNNSQDAPKLRSEIEELQIIYRTCTELIIECRKYVLKQLSEDDVFKDIKDVINSI